MIEKIEVRYQHLGQNKLVPIYHKYIVYTDKNGVEWIARGGPTNKIDPKDYALNLGDVDFGRLDTSWGRLTEKDFEEWKNKDTDARELIKSGADLSADWNNIIKSINSFDSKYCYELTGNNSNATVDTALRDAGLNQPVLDDFSPFNPNPIRLSPGNKFIIPPPDTDGDGLPNCRKRPRPFPPSNPGRWDPLVLDLNGDGVQLTSVTNSTVNFDFGADGFREQTGWVSAQDGLLVLDRNKNGKIDNGTELFGSATQDGFDALAAYDLNGDGVINASDAIFSQLRVWRDANSNGVTDAEELLTLAEAGVKEINLAKTSSGADNAGNRVDYTGTFTRTNGKTGNAAAISFTVNQTLTQWTPPEGYTPSAEAEKLPILKGYGRLKDVAAQASINAAFLKLVKDYVTASAKADAANDNAALLHRTDLMTHNAA